MTNRASEEDWIRWPRLATSAAYLLWDFTSWAELGARQIARARESGALTLLVLALSLQARVATLRGELDAATALVAEANSVKEVTGVQLAPYGSLLLVAYQGQPTALAALEDEPIGPADGYALESIALARAVMNNGLRHYPEALEAAANASRLSAFGQEALPELVEAAVRAGQPDLGRRALSRLSELVVPESDWALGVEARCRALLEQGEAAERCYRLAIECLDRTPLRLDTARARLLYGEWLRRESRRSDSRDQLRRAYETFRAAGAEAFAERARAELAATGETVRRRDVTTQHELTPQEEHIARLARDGRSNPEIGAELFISPRTVEWHLRKVFAKLGVTSRAGLRDALSPVSER
jgi:ATP/maltotriose-dependent transcriptional regulator MalT